MKKEYHKPSVMIESLSLSTTIASGCNVIINNSGEYTCAYYDERENKFLFTNEIEACTTHNEDGEGYCYHVPTDTNDLFNS